MTLDLGYYGISAEQSCILCHLSSECGGCCASCERYGGLCSNKAQLCSRPCKDVDGKRWDTWMHLVAHYSHIAEYAVRVIPPEMQKKYRIDKLIKRRKQ